MDIQEETGRWISRIDESIGDDKGGLTGRLTKVEGIQMLDRSEIADLDRRVKRLEDMATSVDMKVIGALVAAYLALAAFALRLLKNSPIAGGNRSLGILCQSPLVSSIDIDNRESLAAPTRGAFSF